MRTKLFLILATMLPAIWPTGFNSAVARADDDHREKMEKRWEKERERAHKQREKWHKHHRGDSEERREWLEEQRERHEERLEEQRERHEEWLEDERERREEWLEDRGWDDDRRHFRSHRPYASPFYSPAHPGGYYGRSPYYGYDRYAPRQEYYRAPQRRGIWFSF